MGEGFRVRVQFGGHVLRFCGVGFCFCVSVGGGGGAVQILNRL